MHTPRGHAVKIFHLVFVIHTEGGGGGGGGHTHTQTHTHYQKQKHQVGVIRRQRSEGTLSDVRTQKRETHV